MPGLRASRRTKVFAFDTETTSLDAMQAQIVGVSFTDRAGHGAYVPLAHDYPTMPAQLKRDAVLEKLKPLREADQPRKIGQNLKYDLNVLANHGVCLGGLGFDTMLESYVLDATAFAPQHGCARAQVPRLQDAHVRRRRRQRAEPDQLQRGAHRPRQRYAAEDADITLRLHRALWPRRRNPGAGEAVS